MNRTVVLYKNIGETPLECIGRFREENPDYRDEKTLIPHTGRVKISYAGRLDPMAEGLLLLLIGDANKDREKYLGLDKEYEFEVLFGIETDSYDILGKITKVAPDPLVINHERVREEITTLLGKQRFKYPVYSSKPVEGKPLFQWAREGRLSEIEIPTTKVEIYSLEILNSYNISKSDLKNYVFDRIRRVKGDFRQKEIVSTWSKELAACSQTSFSVYKFKISCSSGTYVRSIANELGKRLGVRAIALSIRRTKVGEWK